MADTTSHTLADLEAMDEDEITAASQALGIDPDNFDDWPPLYEAILLAQEGETEATPEPEAEEDEDEAGEEIDGEVETEKTSEDESDQDETDEEDELDDETESVEEGLYTREELEAMPLETLKEVVALNEIPVPGQRPRHKTYVEAILAAQEDEEDVPNAASSTPSAALSPATAPALDEGALAARVAEEVAKAVDTRLTQLAEDLSTRFEEFGRNVVTLLVTTLDSRNEAPAASAARKGIKKITR